MTEDEMVGWHHQLYGHEFEQTLGVCDGQRGLACWSPWCRKELDMTETDLEKLWNFLVIQAGKINNGSATTHVHGLFLILN